jgi:hypothetical protein
MGYGYSEYDERHAIASSEDCAEREEELRHSCREWVLGAMREVYAEPVQTALATGRDILEVLFTEHGADVLVEVTGTGRTLDAVLKEYPEFEADVNNWLS